MKKNRRKRNRNKFKITGNANRLSRASIAHGARTNDKDERGQANDRHVIEHARMPPIEFEVVPGISRANFIPSLGRFGGDQEFSDALTPYLSKEAKIYYEVRTDRPVKRDGTVPLHKRTAIGHAGHFAANFPPHIVLALRWAHQEELPNPMKALEATIKEATARTHSTYHVVVIVAAFHPANPYSYKGRLFEGWELPEDEEPLEDKFGGWNYHLQIYFARVENQRLVALDNRFSYFGTSQLALWWLDQYGVDIHYVTRTKEAYDYRADLISKDKELPRSSQNAVSRGRVTMDRAIDAAVERHMIAWDKAWPGRASKNMKETIESRLAGKSAVQLPVDWFTSVEATKFLEAQLVALRPRYAELLKKGREVYKDIKTAHCECGYTKTLNMLLNDYEAKEKAANEAKRAEKEANDRAEREELIRQQARENEALKETLETLKNEQAEKEVTEAKILEDKEREHEHETADLRSRVASLNGQLTVAIESQGTRAQVLRTALILSRALVQMGGPKVDLPPEISGLVQITSEGYPPVVKVSLAPIIATEVMTAVSMLKAALEGSFQTVAGQDALKASLTAFEAVIALSISPVKLGFAYAVDWSYATEGLEAIRDGVGRPEHLKYLRIEYGAAAVIAVKTGDSFARDFLKILDVLKARRTPDLDLTADKRMNGLVME